MNVLQALPLDGEANLGTNATINLQLDADVDSADVSLRLTPPAPTRLASGDAALIFTPDAPLDASTPYEWEVSLCDAPLASGTFTTRTEGEAVGPRDLVRRAFQLDTRRGQWGMGALEEAFIERYGGIILIEVTEASSSAVDLVLAPGSDLSGVIVQSGGALQRAQGVPFHHNPYLGLSLESLPLTPPGGPVTLYDLTLELAFTNSGVGLSDGRLRATVDLREPSPEGLAERCAALEAELGEGCAPCDDGEPACAHLSLSSMAGGLVAGLHLKEEESQDSGP
ncbi:Ig-like domain-containing protein [Myxococcota bacterium]|nr:Ig-like domain-containing protein [Myxococcota bacterium]